MGIVDEPGYRDRVYELVKQIPPGRVMTYGQIAEILGEDVDVVGLKRALDTPMPLDVPLLDSDPPDPAQRDIPFDSTLEAADIAEAAARAKAEEGVPDSDASDS